MIILIAIIAGLLLGIVLIKKLNQQRPMYQTLMSGLTNKNIEFYVQARKANKVHPKTSPQEPDQYETQAGSNRSLWDVDSSSRLQPLEVSR